MAPRKSKKGTTLKPKEVTHSESQDDGTFNALIQELATSLGAKAFVNIRDTLRRLREIGEKVNSEVVENIVVSIDGFRGACSLLHPNTFVAIVEILLHAESSHYRERGLYLLAASLHNESQKLEGKPQLQTALSIVGNGCLQQVYNSFCDKAEKYETRRWTGLLLLELIVNSDENKQVIELMPESRRRNLGPLVLYEKNEILRTISGRILTTLIASNIPTNNFFPQNTDLELMTSYPEPAVSASQWDRTFQNYLDKIWDKISDIENQGKMEFAQNVTSQPEYLNTKNISVYHRSLYTAFADCVHIYVHSGGKGFDAAIDIPYNLISEVRVELTPLDDVIKVEPPADLILQVRHLEGEYAYVNSAISELSLVRLTFSDMSSTELIAKALREYVAKSSCPRGEQEVTNYDGKASTAQGGRSEVDSQSSTKRKISQSGDGLVLNGEYGAGAANLGIAKTEVEREIPMKEKVLTAESAKISQKAASIAAEMTESLANQSQSKALISVSGGKVQDDYADLYDASPPPPRSQAQKIASKTSNAEQVEVNGRRKLAKPSSVAVRIAVPGPVKSSSQEPEISTLADEHNSTEILYGKRADDGFDSTLNDDSIDETTRILPKKRQAAPSRKIQILKSKKPLNASKQVITATKDVPSPAHLHSAVDQHIHPSVPKNIAGHAQSKVNTDNITRKADKTYGNKEKGRASTGAIPDYQSDAHEVNLPADGKKKRAKKRQSAPVILNQATHVPRSTRSTAISANQKIREMNASQNEDENVRHETSVKSQTKNCSGKAFSPKSPKIQATKDKENTIMGTVIPAEYETVPERSILRAKKVLTAKKTVANKRNETQSEVEPEDIYSDMHETFNQHTSFFEDGTVFQDFEPADLEDEIPPVSVSTSRPVTAMVSKMQKIFGALDDLDDLVQPKQKLRAYGKDSPKVASTSAMPVKQVKENRPKRGTIKTANSPPVQPEPKIRSLGTKSNSRGLSLQKDAEAICISSDEESNASENSEPKQQGTLAKAAPEKSSIKIVPTATVRNGVLQNQGNSESRHLMQGIKAEKLADERTAASVLSKMSSNRLRGAGKNLNKLPSTPNISEVGHISLKRQAINRRSPAQSKMQSTPISDSNAPTTLQTTVSCVTSLVDDHLARKTPLIAFDKNGAKNQGLFSTLRGKAMAKPIQGKDIPLATATAMEELVGKKRMLQDEPLPNLESPTPKRPKVSKSTPNIVEVVDKDQFDANIRDFVQSSSPLALQSDRHVFSSQSRVDENGSPRARTTMAEQSEDMDKIKKNLLSDTREEFKTENPQFNSIPNETWDFHDDYLPPVCDDYPINQEGYNEFSSNHKPQPSAPDQDIDFMARYAPHKSATNGDYVDVVTARALEPTHGFADPFRDQKHRHLSDFAKRLKGETPPRAEIITTVESEYVVAAKAPVQKLSIPFSQAMAADDPNKTLVDVENHLPYELTKPQKQISSDSSDVSDDRTSVEDYEAEELTAEEQWIEALKPHQKNLSDTLHCIVEGFVHQLIDKESALDNIVHDYLKNGTKLVQSIEDRAVTDRRGLQLQVFNTLRQVTSKFQQSRDAANILKGRAQGQLYEAEKAWRKTQHRLQDLVKDKITESKKLMVAEPNA